MTFDDLDDYELEGFMSALARSVKNCQADAPPIAGQADTGRNARLDAERVSLEFGSKSARRLDAGRKPITDAPLFGGPAQEEMF